MPDVEKIYEILVGWARQHGTQTYTQLSEDYKRLTGEEHDPHGSWDVPLGEINVRLSKIDAPPITALVVSKNKNEPGRAFWVGADNVPARPPKKAERLRLLSGIVRDIRAYNWPRLLPK